MARSYLDHASTSPTRPAAVAALTAWFEGAGADPGRIHAEGMSSRVDLENAREQVAAMLGARAREVVFTSGATESIAAASHGARMRDDSRQLVVLSSVEHSAVRQWATKGPFVEVGVDPLGRVDPEELLAPVDDNTALVHIQWGNHEVGTRHAVQEVVDACRARGVLVHIDAAQAAGREPISFTESGADLMSVSGHKFGAPPGTGALLVRRGLRLAPLFVGGDQERARRAGMENVPALVGMGAAAAELSERRDAEDATQRRLTDRVIAWVAHEQGIHVLGDPDDRLSHLVCLGVDGIEPQPVLLGLDQAGVAVHSGSSCSTEALEPSPVLAAMGADAERSLRVSVGWSSTDADIDRFLTALPAVLDRLRALRG